MTHYQLVLASTSKYRQYLLSKLSVPFTTASPQCDETPLKNESPELLVKRLAKTKAESCIVEQPSLIIGSDQVCVIDGDIIGKPLNRKTAIEQLNRQNGKTVQFFTGLAVYNNHLKQTHVHLDTFNVHFRHLKQSQIENYVDKETPYDCAGSFKSEGLGIALFNKLEGKDPNTLVGLPLIDLISMLQVQGVDIL
ncbi:Maf family protein [Vibrio hepatarius]|uniref:Maf family protein n=1 Tax=Vibrio hepatarius TaxID=171383 RepID=UPI001C09E3B0|nr:nucleoside triphosphate pyrophosphatase [Vibrio hepatarius]MBU2897954.1 septum formation inhibitor Maf [Vibrio hepatarius]